jgi:hypothetical protein
VAIAMAEGLRAAIGAGMQLGQEKSERILKEYEGSVEGDVKASAIVGSG